MKVSSIVIVPSQSACSYNLLPRAASKIPYKADAKPRPSNCILPEAQETTLYPFAMEAGQTLH